MNNAFWITYIQPQINAWFSLFGSPSQIVNESIKAATTITAPKYITLAVWIIYWGMFFIIKNKNKTQKDKHIAIDRRSIKPLFWVIVIHFAIYSIFWVNWGYMSFGWLFPVVFFVGIIMLSLGLIISIMSEMALAGNFHFLTLSYPEKPFTRTGIYKIIRHPIYSGMLLIWFGASFIFSNIFGIIIGLLVLLPLLKFRAQIEEENLIKAFGSQYETYINSTGSFFPKI